MGYGICLWHHLFLIFFFISQIKKSRFLKGTFGSVLLKIEACMQKVIGIGGDTKGNLQKFGSYAVILYHFVLIGGLVVEKDMIMCNCNQFHILTTNLMVDCGDECEKSFRRCTLSWASCSRIGKRRQWIGQVVITVEFFQTRCFYLELYSSLDLHYCSMRNKIEFNEFYYFLTWSKLS